MKNNELTKLIESIRMEANDDAQRNLNKTVYKLPSEALVERVSEAIISNFIEKYHFETATIENGMLTLTHPEA
ncbi:hypothetical protein L4C54_12925 [Vibrio lamellibrachiae]|uniref:hypothetical protein n=1 Tax=Vibrio lamellibrachiae TaxID=2910253 RepID=UPI003D124D19